MNMTMLGFDSAERSEAKQERNAKETNKSF
jgi:hypothetical protein